MKNLNLVQLSINMSLIISYICLVISVLFTAFSQVFFKKYFLSKKKYFLFYTLLLFSFIPFTSYVALINLPLSYVYSCASLVYVIVLVCAKYFLGESINKKLIFSSIMIILGILIFNY